MIDYEITAQLTLDISKADEALNAAIEKIKNLEKEVKSSTSNGSKYNKDFSESYYITHSRKQNELTKIAWRILNI